VLRNAVRGPIAGLLALPGRIAGPSRTPARLAIDYVLALADVQGRHGGPTPAPWEPMFRVPPMNRLLEAAADKRVPGSSCQGPAAGAAFEAWYRGTPAKAPSAGRAVESAPGGGLFFDALVGRVHEDAGKPLSLVLGATPTTQTHSSGDSSVTLTAVPSDQHGGAAEGMIDVDTVLGLRGVGRPRRNVPLRLMYNLGACDASGGSDKDPAPGR